MYRIDSINERKFELKVLKKHQEEEEDVDDGDDEENKRNGTQKSATKVYSIKSLPLFLAEKKPPLPVALHRFTSRWLLFSISSSALSKVG